MRAVFERMRLLGAGLLVVAFLAGALTGAAVDRVLSAGESTGGTREAERESRSYVIDRVDLTPEQRAAIDTILEDRAERMRAVWRQVEPRLDAITDSARSEIMHALTPAQRAEYQRMLDRRRERREHARDDDR